MLTLQLKPWRKFEAFRDRKRVDDFLEGIGKDAVLIFRRGERASGRLSRPGEYPAIQTGALNASLDYVVGANQVEVGTNVFYSIFLRNGTRKMARRAMSDNAMRASIARNEGKLKRWIRWQR